MRKHEKMVISPLDLPLIWKLGPDRVKQFLLLHWLTYTCIRSSLARDSWLFGHPWAASWPRRAGTTYSAIRWEQFENWHFSRGYNSWTNDLIRILKTSTRPYSCLAKVIIKSKLGLSVCFIRCRLMKSGGFRTVPIWLHQTVETNR